MMIGHESDRQQGCVVINRTRVMVVDGLTETEEVLRAVLEPRGMQVMRIRSGPNSERTQPADRPSVVVLHEPERSASERATLAGHTRDWGEVPCVVIGRAHHQVPPSNPMRRYLSQPFHYSELLTAIESLTQLESAV